MRRRQHGGVRSCAFTNEQSSRGVYKEAGACALTRAVRDGIKDSNIRYTKCDGCKATMCCSCLDLIADAVLEHSVRVDFNSVWAALARLRLVEDLTVLIAQHPRAAASPLKNDFAPAFVNE